MTPPDGQDGHPTLAAARFDGADRHGNLETMLFEGLVHQLIEKGVLTKNDALSIVQTVAQVKRGQLDDDLASRHIDAELALLRRLYESFEALRSISPSASSIGGNVRQLRPARHGDAPEFTRED